MADPVQTTKPDLYKVTRIIKDGAIVADDWQFVPLASELAPEAHPIPAGRVIVPLPVWQSQRHVLAARGDVGVWLAPADDPQQLADSFGQIALIAVDFPKFTDGRGYSIASLLRSKLHWKGELRAIGDVLHDQLYYMQRVGFNAYALRSDRSAEVGLAALKDFEDIYQFSTDQALPVARRHFGANTAATRGSAT